LANREWSIEVDENGFAYGYAKGGSTSVASPSNIGKYGKQAMIIHNHPKIGEPNFSDADLLNTANSKSRKGIVATSAYGQTFTFTKGTHFNATKFSNAVRKAKLHGIDYTDAVDKWLIANQSRYGYKYKAENYNRGKPAY